MNNKKTWWILALFACIGLGQARAATVEKMLHDTQRIAQGPEQLTLVWWIPSDFWRASMAQNPNLTGEQIDHLVQLLDDYAIFAVVAGKIGPLGGFSARPSDDLRANVALTVGGTPRPIALDANLNADTRNFIAMMKPMIANMLGQLGQSFEFFVYPNAKGDATRLDPKKPGQFVYTVFDQAFEWKLPIGSFLPDMVDAKTGQAFPGDYVFNPYTGDRLKTSEASH